MKIYVIGVGMGNPALLTVQAREAVDASLLLVGSPRLLESFPESRAAKVEAVSPDGVAKALDAHPGVARAAVLVSGDVGFFSLAKGLGRALEGREVEYLPGISSLQYFCARLGVSWEDAAVVSLHGRRGPLLGVAASHEKTFVLAGGENGPAEVCRELCAGGLGRLRVHVGEALSYPGEQITSGTAAEFQERAFSPLSVLLLQNARPAPAPVTHGLPDAAFLRGEIPMTKEEVRAVSLAKLRLRRGQTLWDVGAGTGSISVEAARVLWDGAVYAVERNPDALALLEQNRTRFSLPNLRVVAGSAPQALERLPVPDAVFVGGSSGALERILSLALERSPAARLVVNAVTLETAAAALDFFKSRGLPDQNIVQLSVARAKAAGGSRMLTGQNPVFILSAGGKTDGA